jgi:hypothetical protein
MSAREAVLFFGIHNTVGWWRHIGQHMGWGPVSVVTDLRGEGDISVVDDFYSNLRQSRRRPQADFDLLSTEQRADVVARCRTLRWLEPDLAQAMIEAMARALDKVLETTSPRVIVSFPIDRYVKHVLKLLAASRGIHYLELTASVLPSMSMLLQGGRLVKSSEPVDEVDVERHVAELAAPDFVPSYVPSKNQYTTLRFIRTLGYFRARAVAMRAIAWWQRDPFNLHYLDAQPFLGHKCRWSDIRILRLCNPNWRDKAQEFPRNRRILFGLQLFPEASIDYWIEPIELIEHENLVVRAARAFSAAGFLVIVKDHPLQFGFRQTDFVDKLRQVPNVLFLPYDVQASELIALSEANFTFTGTLGLQAALQGLRSIVTDSYYSNEEDFTVFRSPTEIDALPKRIAESDLSDQPLHLRRTRIVRHLLQGSFSGDFFSFKGFGRSAESPVADQMGRALGLRLRELCEQGVI